MLANHNKHMVGRTIHDDYVKWYCYAHDIGGRVSHKEYHDAGYHGSDGCNCQQKFLPIDEIKVGDFVITHGTVIRTEIRTVITTASGKTISDSHVRVVQN